MGLCCLALLVKANIQPADQCASSRRFDYVLDQQAYVAIDNNEPLNEDIINDFLKDPVHQVCEPSAFRGMTIKEVCHHSQLLASTYASASSSWQNESQHTLPAPAASTWQAC